MVAGTPASSDHRRRQAREGTSRRGMDAHYDPPPSNERFPRQYEYTWPSAEHQMPHPSSQTQSLQPSYQSPQHCRICTVCQNCTSLFNAVGSHYYCRRHNRVALWVPPGTSSHHCPNTVSYQHRVSASSARPDQSGSTQPYANTGGYAANSSAWSAQDLPGQGSLPWTPDQPPSSPTAPYVYAGTSEQGQSRYSRSNPPGWSNTYTTEPQQYSPSPMVCHRCGSRIYR